jgi:hypothetical protein
LWCLEKVGVVDADISVDRGLDYVKALNLCKSTLEFLGTGASKLSKLSEFEGALVRCRNDRPARFLLSKPDADVLERAAKRAGVDIEHYSHTVTESLRRIAKLVHGRGLNIEVRFYSRPPVFRLMFIDRALCLVSYNYYGEGDGSQLPQLCLRRVKGGREVGSFYWAVEKYFDELWEDSDIWDPEEYLE